MKIQFLSLIYTQKGYAQLEEGKLSSESKDVYSSPNVTSRGCFDRAELASRFLCGLMFVGGALMLFAATYMEQSDKDCASQLSMWCEYEDKSLDSRPNAALRVKFQCDCQLPSWRPSSTKRKTG